MPRTSFFNEEEPVFYIKVRAKQPVSTANSISLDAGFDNLSMNRQGVIQKVNLSVREVNVNAPTEVEFFPNPFTDNLTVMVAVAQPRRAIQQLMDAKGRILFNREVFLLPGENALDISALSALPAGLYLHRLITDDADITTKLIKG